MWMERKWNCKSGKRWQLWKCFVVVFSAEFWALPKRNVFFSVSDSHLSPQVEPPFCVPLTSRTFVLMLPCTFPHVCSCVQGHSGAGEVQDHHHSLLQRSHGEPQTPQVLKLFFAHSFRLHCHRASSWCMTSLTRSPSKTSRTGWRASKRWGHFPSD